MPRAVVCLTTVGSRRDGEKIARYLVTKKLVACVNILPGALSLYIWKKKLCRDREVLLLIKTIPKKVPALEAALRKIHPYELPEFLVLPVLGGSRKYLKWLLEGVKSVASWRSQ
jgi:periplasmic divalent cation tolerance protein